MTQTSLKSHAAKSAPNQQSDELTSCLSRNFHPATSDYFPGRIAILSTYPPTECGIATFARSLAEALKVNGARVDILQIADSVTSSSNSQVVAQHRGKSDISKTAQILNAYDQVLIQHEFGIFDGPDGDEIFELLDALQVPVAVVLHTVLTEPSLRQRAILNYICDKAAAVITMTQAGRAKLIANYDVAVSNVHVIGHGARAISDSSSLAARENARPRILTWGLIGPGKGIEWAIDAVAALQDLDSPPEYVIAGQTHPHVKHRDGESYRDGLKASINQYGIADSVNFIDHYLTDSELDELITSADVVLLPYDSVEQVTSGVLVEALVAGVPIVATNFPHAREVLSDNSGILVKQRDALGIALAIRAILTSKNRADAMRHRLNRKSNAYLWPAIGKKYLEVLNSLQRESSSVPSDSLVG
ncbi:MAG: glycosyltransferase [Actinomycetales bacterium]|nr:glycosyltransferase [Actinomycetales bacterium]